MSARGFDRFVFVSFNKRVAALDRDTGEIMWEWRAAKGSGFVAMLLDGDRLIVSCQGWTWCLDPRDGSQLWEQPFRGYGFGIPCLLSAQSGASGGGAAASIAAQQAAATAAAAGASVAATSAASAG